MAIRLNSIKDLINSLSWQKIFQALVLILILLGGWGFWENRITIYNSIKVGARVETDDPLVINVSSTTKAQFNLALEKSKDLVAGLQIISVNFKRNNRSTSYFAFNDRDLKLAYEHFAETRIAETPLFTDSVINNQRIINLINGDFVCYDYKDTPAFKLYAQSLKNVTTVCSISIPPYYGRFTGYLNIYLTRKPENEEFVLVKQLARDMALRVYETDIDRSSKGYKG